MRNNTRVRALISILAGLTLSFAGCSREEPADIVLLGGGIYTVDTNRHWAEAAAIRGGLIVAVGDDDEIAKYIGTTTRVVELQGRMAMPGIHDSHIHPLEGAYEQVHCDVSSGESVAAVQILLRECAASHSGEWFNAVGLDLALFPVTGPDRSLLEGIAPDSYIFVDGADGHAALVNDRALALAGIDADTQPPPGGVIERRPGSNEPNGTIRESARDLVDRLRPPRSLFVSAEAMRDTIKLMNSHGITSIIDMWAGEHEWQVYQALEWSGDLTVRVHNALIDEGVFEKHVGEDFGRVLAARGNYESDLVSNGAIKIMVDGVFEGETGAVLEPYVGTDDYLGELNHDSDELTRRVQRYYDMGLQLHFHTMGDRAARAALDALEVARDNGQEHARNLRHSLSHLGLIHPDDMPRFAELNAAPSFTTVWAYSDEWTANLEIPTLGRERVSELYPLRSVSAAGAVVVGGSDWNYGALDPLLSIETGVTRSDPNGPSDFEQFTAEAVGLDLMIDAYTINGAWLVHEDDRLGSIETGKRADILVYDRNLFELEPSEISEAVVELTIFDGRVVYDRSLASNENN